MFHFIYFVFIFLLLLRIWKKNKFIWNIATNRLIIEIHGIFRFLVVATKVKNNLSSFWQFSSIMYTSGNDFNSHFTKVNKDIQTCLKIMLFIYFYLGGQIWQCPGVYFWFCAQGDYIWSWGTAPYWALSQVILILNIWDQL